MKIGIITDVHSNIIALNTVLNEFEKIKQAIKILLEKSLFCTQSY